jgi:hypothetical protein
MASGGKTDDAYFIRLNAEFRRPASHCSYRPLRILNRSGVSVAPASMAVINNKRGDAQVV